MTSSPSQKRIVTRWGIHRWMVVIAVILAPLMMLQNVAVLRQLQIPDIPEHFWMQGIKVPSLGNSPSNANTTLPMGSLFHFIHSSSEETFGKKELKSIESVFFHHPKAHVRLWVTEMTIKPVQALLDQGYHLTLEPLNLKREIESLLEYSSINQTLVSTFLSRWDSHIQTSFWMINHSDLMRLIVLYKHGGIYLDTDTITIKPFDDSLRNSVGQQKSTGQSSLNGAVMMFEKGNDFLRDCIEDCYAHFNGNQWGRQGPALISRVYRRKEYPPNVVQIQPRVRFYPYQPAISELCFQNTTSKAARRRRQPPPTIDEMVNETYVVHTYNKMTGNLTAASGSRCDCLLRAFCVVSQDCSPRCTLFDPPKRKVEVEYF